MNPPSPTTARPKCETGRLVAIPPRERAAGRMKSVKKAERKKTTCQRSSRKLTSFSPALWSAKKKLPARM
jgi:hypothetical protein